MADLGTAVGLATVGAKRFLPQAPLTIPRSLWAVGDLLTPVVQVEPVPLAAQVTTPLPVGATAAFECYGPGAFVFLRQVPPGTVVVQARIRKSADYPSRNLASGLGHEISALPTLELTRDDGARAVATMPDVSDTYQTLTASLTIVTTGVLTIRLVHPGVPGSNRLFARTRGGDPRAWWARLVVTTH